MRCKENKIDWKMLAGVDLSSFEEEIDRKRWPIYEMAEMISTFNVDAEFNVSAIDHHFVKVFRLTQSLLKHFSSECKHMKSLESEYNKDRDVIDENKKLKKLLKIYQRAFSYADIDAMSNSLQCPHCPKAFSEVLSLKNHISRRHPKNGLEAEGTLVLSNKIAEYKAALLTDSQVMKNVHKELNDINDKLKVTEAALFEEREERKKLEEKMEMEITQKVEEIQESLRESEQLKSEKVLNQLKSDFQNQLIQANLRNESDDERGLSVEMDAKAFQKILLMQTNEVQRIGSNIEKMVSLLSPGEQQHKNVIKSLPKATIPPHQSISTDHVSAATVEAPKEVPVPAKRTQRETIAQESKEEPDVVVKQIDRNDISAKIDEELKQMGINGDKISKDEYNGAMKQIFDCRKMKSSYKELQKLVDIKASIELSKEEVLGRERRDTSAAEVTKSIQDKEPSIKVVVEERAPIKSVLKRSNGDSRPKKRIRFSEKNIEISPESSDDDEVHFNNDNISIIKRQDNVDDENLDDIDLTESDDEVFERESSVKTASPTAEIDDHSDATLKNKPSVGELTKLIEEKLSVQTRRPGSAAVNTVARNDKKFELKTTAISSYSGHESD